MANHLHKMKSIYFGGNFLSKPTGITSVWEELSVLFISNSWIVTRASHYLNRVLRMIDFIWTAISKRNQYQVAAVEVYSFLAFRWAELLCLVLKVLKKPYVVTLHGGRLPEFAQKFPGKFRKFISAATVVTTPSKYLMEKFLPIRQDIKYIPNGLELIRYPYSAQSTLEPHLIWQHSFHKIYNPTMAVEVLLKLLEDFPDAKLTMIGPNKKDGSFEEVVSLIEQNQISNRVEFTGRIEKAKVGEFLSQGSFFINTTNYESFGVSVLEAAACGLCIIATNVGEIPYMWKDGTDAVLVPPNAPIAMAEVIKSILHNPDLFYSLRANARKKAESYDWSLIFPVWENMIKQLIEEHHERF